MPVSKKQLKTAMPGFGIVAYVLLLATMFPLPGAARNKKNDPDEIGNRDVAGGINFYSLARETELGKQLVSEVELEYRILDDPFINKYVNRVGQYLVLNSDVRMPVIIKVLDNESVNALALPGGFLYVNAGLILATTSEAELAAALAHEISHIAARHATRQATWSTIMDYASLSLIFVGGQAGFLAREASRLASPVGYSKFSRIYESEADFLGLQYAYKAGYDPTAFIDLFERLDSAAHRKPNVVLRLISTPPTFSTRSKAIAGKIRKICEPKSEYVVNTSEFDEARSHLQLIYQRRHQADSASYRLTLRVRK